MLTFGELLAFPARIKELEGADVLIAATVGTEVVVRNASKPPETTMIFQHETIAMMRAERAEQIDKLKKQINAKSVILPIKKRGDSFWDAGQITVGRASTSDIVLEDRAISNVHAHFELRVNDHPVSIQDLGSSNGTFLNRVPLQPYVLTPLRSGDCLRFGQTVFYFISLGTLKDMLPR